MYDDVEHEALESAINGLLADIGAIGLPGSADERSRGWADKMRSGMSRQQFYDAISDERKNAGWTRLAFTAEEDAVHDLAADIMRQRGFHVYRDGFGNLFGRKGDMDARALMLGTHLDTVTDGGNYDGVVGFITALEGIAMAERLGSALPVEIAVFRAEESTRFKRACLGSRAAFGFLSPQDLRVLSAVGSRGEVITLHEALQASGRDPRSVISASKSADRYLAYMETHIEQARVLETVGALGLVTSIRAPERRRMRISGGKSVKAAAAIVLAVEWTCRLFASMGEDVVGTIGKAVGFFEGADKINAVAGRVAIHVRELKRNRHLILEGIARGLDVEVMNVDPAFGARLEIVGETDHSGGTPMGRSFRRDALVAASEIVLSLEDDCFPEGESIELFLDLRSNSINTRSKVSAEIVHTCQRIALGFHSRVEIDDPVEETQPISELSPTFREHVRESARRLGLAVEDIPSGAGHDAMFAHKAGILSGMVFVPSARGLSHNPREYTSSKHIADAVKLQADVILKLEGAALKDE